MTWARRRTPSAGFFRLERTPSRASAWKAPLHGPAFTEGTPSWKMPRLCLSAPLWQKPRRAFARAGTRPFLPSPPRPLAAAYTSTHPLLSGFPVPFPPPRRSPRPPLPGSHRSFRRPRRSPRRRLPVPRSFPFRPGLKKRGRHRRRAFFSPSPISHLRNPTRLLLSPPFPKTGRPLGAQRRTAVSFFAYPGSTRPLRAAARGCRSSPADSPAKHQNNRQTGSASHNPPAAHQFHTG